MRAQVLGGKSGLVVGGGSTFSVIGVRGGDCETEWAWFGAVDELEGGVL